MQVPYILQFEYNYIRRLGIDIFILIKNVHMYFLDEVVKTENIHILGTYDYLYIYDQKSVSNEVKHTIEIS